MEKIVGRKT